MRVLLGSDTYLPDCNGAAYFTHRLAHGLRGRGHDIELVCPSLDRRSGNEVRDGLPILRVASIPVPLYPALRFSPRPPRSDRLLEGAIRDFAPDVVHVQNHFFLSRALIRAANRLGVPAVATNHFVPENIGVQIGFFPRPVRRWAVRWLARDLVRSYATATAIAAPTPTAAGLLEATGTHHSVIPISCGIDLALYPQQRRHAAQVRARFGLPDRPTVLFVGRLDLEKNLDELIEAFGKTRVDGLDAQLVLVGKGKERPKLEALARSAGIADRVLFTGFVSDDDLPHVYGAGDVFCMPGTAELQSIVTLEAMASGLPVIAADALALPHLARDGDNGYTYPPGDSGALAGLLGKLLSDPALGDRMGARSREIVAGHDFERSLDAYERFYAGALRQRVDGDEIRPASEQLAAPEQVGVA